MSDMFKKPDGLHIYTFESDKSKAIAQEGHETDMSWAPQFTVLIRGGRKASSLAVLPLRSALVPRYGRRPLPPVEHAEYA